MIDILSANEFEIKGLKIKGGVAKKIVKNFQTAHHPEKPYLNEYEHAIEKWVKDTLSRNDERMVIFIDDLDRCMPDIALQVLEALKLYLNIDRLIFVIGMDRGIVEKAVKAYCKDKNIDIEDDDSYEKKYLDKMFQVELQLSPLKNEMDIYLDEQLQTVEYEQNLEYKDEQGNKKFYTLFKRLISKYGVRNPREVKRLINSSLIRGAGAERIEKEGNHNTLTFEQGVQVFFIQKILEKQWGRMELVGDGGSGDGFFTLWSKIVCENDGEPDFKRNLALPENFHQQLQEIDDKMRFEPSDKLIDKLNELYDLVVYLKYTVRNTINLLSIPNTTSCQ